MFLIVAGFHVATRIVLHGAKKPLTCRLPAIVFATCLHMALLRLMSDVLHAFFCFRGTCWENVVVVGTG